MGKTYFVSDLHCGNANICKYSARYWALADYPEIAQQIRDADGDDEKIASIKMPKEIVPVMEDYIFDKINAKVGPEDRLFILGDIGFANSANQFRTRVQGWRGRIGAGQVYLVVGNHERVPSFNNPGEGRPQDRENYLDAIKDIFDGVYEQVMVYCEDNIKVWCSHYPAITWPDASKKGLPGETKPHKTIALMAAGHVHGKYTKGQRNFHINPVSLEHDWACVDVGLDASDRWPWSAAELYEKCLPIIKRIISGDRK